MRMIIHHIFLCFPACKPFYIASLFKLLWEKLHQISQTLNIVLQIEYYTKSEKDTNFSDLKVIHCKKDLTEGFRKSTISSIQRLLNNEAERDKNIK